MWYLGTIRVNLFRLPYYHIVVTEHPYFGRQTKGQMRAPDIVLCQCLQLVPECRDDPDERMPDHHELEVVNSVLSSYL